MLVLGGDVFSSSSSSSSSSEDELGLVGKPLGQFCVMLYGRNPQCDSYDNTGKGRGEGKERRRDVVFLCKI